MKVIIIKVKECLQCPKFFKCGPSKKLTPKQRFAIKTSPSTSGLVLKDCPLMDYDEKKHSF